MIAWGIIASAIGFTQGAHSFYILRFVLGAAEAGFLPGVVYYIALWYPAGYRAKPYAYFLSCSVLGYIVVGPLSTWLMTVSNGIHGLAGWRWLFVLEGIPCVIFGIVTLVYLTDYPRRRHGWSRKRRPGCTIRWKPNIAPSSRRALLARVVLMDKRLC